MPLARPRPQRQVASAAMPECGRRRPSGLLPLLGSATAIVPPSSLRLRLAPSEKHGALRLPPPPPPPTTDNNLTKEDPSLRVLSVRVGSSAACPPSNFGSRLQKLLQTPVVSVFFIFVGLQKLLQTPGGLCFLSRSHRRPQVTGRLAPGPGVRRDCVARIDNSSKVVGTHRHRVVGRTHAPAAHHLSVPAVVVRRF